MRGICGDKLKIPFDELFEHFKKGGDEDKRVTEQDLRQLLFCDFSDPKNDDKFYKEITDMCAFRKVSEQLLDKYNSVSRKPMDLVLFNFALEHLCRISRVLKQPESHTMLVGVGGSGRQSLSRLAAHIAGCEFHEVEMSKEDGLKEWREHMKAIMKKTSTTLTQHALFLYDNQVRSLIYENLYFRKNYYCFQMTDDHYVEDINNMLYSGEIPNLYSHEERIDIVENMRTLEKQLDKSVHTDGSGPALFGLFVRRVRENLHIVFAMSPFSDAFRKSIAKFPALLNCCTINWVHQWPDDALNFVSNKFLRNIEFKEGELPRCIELCEYFHNSTIRLSKQVRIKHNLFNYVTPASYLELNSLFKSLLLEHRKKVEETKRMYEVSLDKLRGAEGQVTVMQEEMAAIQPNLVQASKEVDSCMAMVDKEQVEVVELEKTVKAEDALVNEKKKLVETVSNECEAEFTEVNGVLESALDTLAGVTPSEIAAVRAVKTPSLSLRLNLEAILLYKGVKPDRVPDPNATGKMVDDYWTTSKRLLTDPKFVESIGNLDKDNIPPKTAKHVRDKLIANGELNPDKSKSSIPAIDNVAKAFYCWVVAVDMYEKITRAVAPKRESLQKAETDHEEAVEKLDTKKHQLRDAQEKLKDISDRMQLKKQKKAELENEVDLCSRKLERAEQLITGFGGEREKWSSMSDHLETKLGQLTGDILLSAGMVAYLGAFPYEERGQQVKEWMGKAGEIGITYSDDWSLKSVLGNQITIQSWYMNGLLRDDFSTDNGLILSTAKRWVLMVDPQDIANR